MSESGAGRRALAVALVLGLSACGGPPYGEAWVRSFNAGRRATAAGRYEDAAAQYAQAAQDAVRTKDRDEARFMQARMMLRLGRAAEADVILARILSEAPDGPRGARVSIERARLAIDAGDDGGYQLLEAAIARYSDNGAVRGAVMQWVEHLRATGTEERLRARIDALLPKVSASETVQHLQYERAISFERASLLSEAHAGFLHAARAHPLPDGNLTDDSYWRASLVAEKQGDAKGAIADLRELLDAREVAWFGQSYERPKYPLAQMRIAELYRDALRDDRAARDEFRRVAENHATSILADDAIWQAALASKRLGDDDDACRTATRLRESYPVARYVGCLSAVCATFMPPAGTRACPAYLQAQLAPGAALPRTSAPEPASGELRNAAGEGG